MDSLLLATPATSEGAFQYAFSHLAESEQADPGAWSRMADEQRHVFALGTLRLEVAGGGFEGYFLYAGGDTAPAALEAADLIGPEWVGLVSDARALFGDHYPVDRESREIAVNELLHRDPRVFAALDARFDALPASEADARLDAYVWEHRAAFFD